MAKNVDTRMKRWMEQRWLLDTVVRTVGLEWDQARLAYMSAPGGPEATGEFRRRDFILLFLFFNRCFRRLLGCFHPRPHKETNYT